MPSLLSRLRSFLTPAPAHTVKLTTNLTETDNNFYPGTSLTRLYRDRFDYDRQTILAECLRSWRVNPLARRIVKLYSQFIIGEGISIESEHQATDKWITQWQNHRLNNIPLQMLNWCDELTRAGNLFFLYSVDAGGMVFVRPVAADQIKEIQTSKNDYMQETAYLPIE